MSAQKPRQKAFLGSKLNFFFGINTAETDFFAFLPFSCPPPSLTRFKLSDHYYNKATGGPPVFLGQLVTRLPL